MASRRTSYLLASLLISCLLSFGFSYKELFPSPKIFQKIQPEFLEDDIFGKPGISIPLHPERHISRAPTTIKLYWEITQGYRSPDGVRKLVYLINGLFPGPTIEARSGDTIKVGVHNLLEYEGVAIHWHGIHMKGANRMDGAVGITQNPIQPGCSITYEFGIEDTQAGTFWYHSHLGIQRADGLYGGLIIHPPLIDKIQKTKTLEYIEESLLLVGDWYHRSAEIVQASYVNHDSWGREPVPDSLLINGMGSFNCSKAVQSRPLHCAQSSSSPLVLNQPRTRIRVVNVGAISGLVFRMPHCHMTIIEIDGGNEIERSPEVSSVGILYPGERMDLLVECPMGSEAAGSHLSITLDAENFAIQNKALTPTHTFPISTTANVFTKRGHPYLPPKIVKGEGYFDLAEVNGTALPDNSFSMIADQTVLLYTKMEILARLGNVPVGFINRTTWAAQGSPPEPLVDLDRVDWDKNQLVPWIPISRDQSSPSWVDIVVNNLDEKGHPFHLHGYDFYVLSQYYPTRRGYHAYNPFDPYTPPTSSDLPGGPYNLANPPLKDTVYVPSQGYVVLRIRADNVGIWFFHCHILWHSGAGMAMALEVGYHNE
ncbi:Laccase [Lachnellula subtilissima]|uniref:Laccase n=1 Tax=Lachnellula subtilissima TaxID=602034 RepID=A0A8H8UC32_9HELO|nr:Laccase [Lachnellula subtilissima]